MKLNYQQAIEESLKRRWKIGTCSQGEECWCRTIKCEYPLMFSESRDSEEEEYHVVRSGELNRETVEHLVTIHNQQVESLETPVSDFLLEKSTFVRWMRERDEISRETADEWMTKFYNQAKDLELKQK